MNKQPNKVVHVSYFTLLYSLSPSLSIYIYLDERDFKIIWKSGT